MIKRERGRKMRQSFLMREVVKFITSLIRTITIMISLRSRLRLRLWVYVCFYCHAFFSLIQKVNRFLSSSPPALLCLTVFRPLLVFLSHTCLASISKTNE